MDWMAQVPPAPPAGARGFRLLLRTGSISTGPPTGHGVRGGGAERGPPRLRPDPSCGGGETPLNTGRRPPPGGRLEDGACHYRLEVAPLG